MYWAHRREDKSFLIESSALDGSERDVVINTNESAHSLSIDFTTNRLYFVYFESSKIAYFDLKAQVVSKSTKASKFPLIFVFLFCAGR